MQVCKVEVRDRAFVVSKQGGPRQGGGPTHRVLCVTYSYGTAYKHTEHSCRKQYFFNFVSNILNVTIYRL